jgi:hypothetical protein
MQHRTLIDLIDLGGQIRKDEKSVPEWLITKFNSFVKDKKHYPLEWHFNNQPVWSDKRNEMYVESFPYVHCSCGENHNCIIENGYVVFSDGEDDNSWDPGNGY